MKTKKPTRRKPQRRLGAESSTQRLRFVDAAEAILREVGYIGLSAREVAAKAQLKTQLLYYYFRTMDEVILAVVRRVNERRLERFHAALATSEPLRALWELNSDPTGAALSAELTSIAIHREAVRAEIVKSAEQFRALQIREVSRLLAQRGNGAAYPAAGIVLIAAALGRTLVSESALGLTVGHAQALQIVERVMRALQPQDRKSRLKKA